ncbi:TetR/AcrR family transcriptional regulator [Amycolatopsis sp. Hca4]|uniref:TetR/AcrR family transcriptional regulator n=1 Tax=Amycolatopsis sp. Hca4 TaxID=2742131 RepID=UPI001591ACCF|nr:TetR/AcrR family transcriptional regulator [Amycolatopsis sp. Hca4]QKV74101.1 TetR/AcrR family transcriptional regulator [Amycolatopsis sp. Hca4]
MVDSTEGNRVSGGAVLRPRVTDAITDAAFAELAETGYARTSMDAVARRAGVGKAALYRRWRSKQAMLAELIRDKVADALPPTPDTGALRTDLRDLFATFRAQLTHPLITRIGAGLLAEAEHDATLAEVLQTGVAEPRRAAARAILCAAIDRGELPSGVELELGTDLLIAPLAFRALVLKRPIEDEYLDALTRAIEAALKGLAQR